jgi:hypothetical protein
MLCSGVWERLMDGGGGEVWEGSCVSSFFVPCRFARAISAFRIHNTQVAHDIQPFPVTCLLWEFAL